jgi:hypothetical protein
MLSNTDSPTDLVREDEDEGLFSRDINGQLVRLDAPVERDYTRNITLQIDGQSVTVPMAEPMQDANGNILLDLEGRTTPRYTTIFDAATKLYVHQPGDEAKIPIPVLCHQSHMKPVAVCRLCVVQIYGQKRGKRAAERKLLPACQHQVKEGMEVFTMQDAGPDGERVRKSVRTLTELLSADHLKAAPRAELEKELAPFNELGQLAARCWGASGQRCPALLLLQPAGAGARPPRPAGWRLARLRRRHQTPPPAAAWTAGLAPHPGSGLWAGRWDGMSLSVKLHGGSCYGVEHERCSESF